MSYPRVFGCFDLKLHHMWLRDSMDWYCLLPSKQGQLWKIAHSKQECSLQMGLELLGLKPADLPKQSLLAMYHSFIGSLQMNSPRVSFHPNSHHPSHPVPSCPILSAQWCRPKFLAIHNSNLPGHAGWIPAQLKRRAATAQDDHAWYELMNGSLGLWGDLELGLLKVSLQAEWSLMFLGVQTLNDMSSFVVLDGLNGLTTTN